MGLVHVTQSERGPRIHNRSLDLAAVADNGGVGCEAVDVLVSESGDGVGAEAPESLPECLTFGEDSAPREARLKSFEGETFKHAGLVVDRHPPLVVVVVTQEAVVGRPGGTHEAVLAQRQAIGKGNGNRAFNRGVHSPILRVPLAFGQTPL